MTKKRPEAGFPHNPDPTPGAEAKLRRGGDGNVTISFGDGSEPLEVDRREFLRISGVAAATAAMAGAGCDDWRHPIDKIVPFVDRPEEFRPGFPNYYASICPGCASQCGVLVKTRGMRPIKLEGNPQHPVSRGALCARGQASYLNLYDPDRARQPLAVRPDGRHREVSWEEVDRAMIAALEKAGTAGGVAILTETVHGPGRQALLNEIAEARPNVRHYTWDPLNSEALLRANALTYGKPHVPHYRFDRADLVVSLGSDFLGTWLSPVEFTKMFANQRDPEGGKMNRLVAFEGHLSTTGMNADDRYRVRPSDLHLVALALLHVVVMTRQTGALARDAAVTAAVRPFTPAAVAELTGLDAEVLTKVGQQLADHAGRSIVVAGGLASSGENGLALEVAINMLNATLGNDGKTIERTRNSYQAQGAFSQLRQLVADIEAGKIDVLILHGANPVYSAPPEFEIGKALQKVKTVVSTSERVDETSLYAKFLAPASHELEAWGDSNPIEGVYAIQQPVITPLYSTRAFEASLMQWFGQPGLVPRLQPFLEAADDAPGLHVPGAGVPVDPGAWYRYLREFWEKSIFPLADSLAGFERFWEDTLRTGVFINRNAASEVGGFRSGPAAAELPKALPQPREAADPGDLNAKEVQLFASIPLYDGRHANNGHLQELPDPVTKHVWGSYITVSPRTFKAAGLEQGQHLAVTVDGRTRTFPVIMQPGCHDDVVAIPLGYGRESVGVVGNDVGQNAYLFTRVGEDRQLFTGLSAEIKKTVERETLAIAQGAHVIDPHRRPILGTTTWEEYQEDPASGIHAHPPMHDLWDEHDYGTLKWGMAIDMTKCTGCSSCVVACMEENNVPVVGRQGVIEGREMHWLRIDRYYQIPHEAAHLQHDLTDDPLLEKEPVVALADYMDNPRVLNQPMLCQHCENAPCETVCPVSATMHSHDGLSQMVYNRCVGTRYCSNNCPYKVRRFNWYNYTVDRSDSVFARLYPEMKVHSRLNVEEPLPMQFNPDVTVRSRGVMEKCSFCVQRIRRAQTDLRKEGRSRFRDGDVITACQQTCPADAIVFGNLRDENSAVARLYRRPRAVYALAELGTVPSIGYLSSVWNTEPEAHADGHGDHGAAAAEEDHG